jgi:hypothetical protein
VVYRIDNSRKGVRNIPIFRERLEAGVREGDITVVRIVCLEVIELGQDMTFTDPEISFKLALISIRVNTVRYSTLGRDILRILARIGWADKNNIKIRGEVWEDYNGLDYILYKTNIIARIVVLVPAIPKEDHLDVGAGDNHLLNLCELWEGVRNRPGVHLVVRRHHIRSTILRIP